MGITGALVLANQSARHIYYKYKSYYKCILLNNRVARTEEKIGQRSWQYGSSAAKSVQKWPKVDILPSAVPNQLGREEVYYTTEMFRKNAMITDWKNIANFKRAIMIGGPPIRRILTSVVKTKKEERDLEEKKRNSLFESSFFQKRKP